MGFLEHATGAIRTVLGERTSLLFVPLAGSDPDTYTTTMRQALARMDVRVTGLHEVSDAARAVRDAEAIFVGGGNTFRLLRALNRLGILDTLRRTVADGGTPYLGASAGSNLACPSIRTTNDMPIVEVPSLAALGLLPFQLNPHYLDHDPHSTHQGETRQQRIEEFLEENDVPVLGLREGAWLRVSGRRRPVVPARDHAAFRRRVGSLAGALACRVRAHSLLADFVRRDPVSFLGHTFQAAPVAFPPRLVTLCHVVVAAAQPGGAVDELTDDVGLAGMPVGFGDHMDQDLVQRHLAPVFRPPRHVAHRVQGQRADRGVRVRPGPPVQPGDLLPRLSGGGPHVGVGLRVGLQPRQPLAEGPAEAVAEVAEFDAGHMLDQSKQVGARGYHRAPDVVLREPVELPEQSLPSILQVSVKVFLGI